MGIKRIVALGPLCLAVAAALATFGIRWQHASTTRQPIELGPQLRPPLRVVMAEAAVGQPAVVKSAVPTFIFESDEPNRERTREARRVALEEIAALTDERGEHAESALAAAALSHTEIAVREEAIHALGERGGAVALQILQQVLQDPDPRIRAAAVPALVDVGGAGAVWALGGALATGEDSLRLSVVDALGEIGRLETTRYLEQALQDRNGLVREAAGEWLAELSDQQEQAASSSTSFVKRTPAR